VSDPLNFFTDGEQYERQMGRWSRLVGDKFIDWLALPMGLRWLDVGCGNGAFTEMVIARCAPAEAHGIDPSEAQIAYASAREAGKFAHFRTGMPAHCLTVTPLLTSQRWRSSSASFPTQPKQSLKWCASYGRAVGS
jgi:SAM-dependent methyltransferase